MRKSIFILFFMWSFLGYSQNDLYCLNDFAGWYRLSKLNTTTGLLTEIAPIPAVAFYVLGNKQCINTHDSTYTFSGHDGTNARLYTVSLATGAIVHNPVFSNVVVGLQYNCEDSTIYAIEEVTTNNYYLVTVDKATGLTSQIGIVGGVSAYVGDGFTLDVKRGLYYMFGLFNSNIHLYSIDITTGLVTASPPFPDNVTGLVYNCNDSTAYGLWEDGLDYKLERIIPSTGVHSTIGVLSNIEPGFVAESASVSRNGEYTYRGFSNSNPVLVTIDLQTANVISNVNFTNNISGIGHYVCCSESQVTALNEVKKVSEVSIYPIPFHDKVKLEWDGKVKNATLNIYDIYGKLIISQSEINGTSYELRRDNLAAGIHIVELKTENQIILKAKIVAD